MGYNDGGLLCAFHREREVDRGRLYRSDLVFSCGGVELKCAYSTHVSVAKYRSYAQLRKELGSYYVTDLTDTYLGNIIFRMFQWFCVFNSRGVNSGPGIERGRERQGEPDNPPL